MSMKDFCSKHGITEKQFVGEEVIQMELQLDALTEIPDGFNPTVGGHLWLDGLTEIPDGFNPTVGGHLWLDGLKEIPEGFNPTVGGNLCLSGLTKIPEGFNPTVGGHLWLDGLKEIPEGFNPTVGGNLWLDGLKEIPEGFNPTVGGNLCLSGLTKIPEGFNPTVGNALYLDGLKEIPEGFNPTVGGHLWLDGLSEAPEGFNPTVGKAMKCGRNFCNVNSKIGMLSWQEGKYILQDGIFSEVISRRGNVWRIRQVGRDCTWYLVSDGHGRFAHGNTLAEAKESLLFKIGNRDVSDFEGLSLDDMLDFQSCVTLYRVVTGACAAGVRRFIESSNIQRRSYSVREVIEKTRGAYGADELQKFFSNLS